MPKMKDSDWIQIGEVGVDAGLLTIGDPCYFDKFDYDRDVLPTVLGGYDRNENHWELPQGMIVFSTTWGDGVYPVYAKFDRNNRPTEVKVVMDYSEGDYSDGDWEIWDEEDEEDDD